MAEVGEKMDTHIPKHIIHILNKLNSSGFEAYLVGGCVRDMLIGRRIHDWDITTSAKPEETAGLFGKTCCTGLKYGTVTVFYNGKSAEVTTFRTDGEYKNSRSPENVKFLNSISGDLERRDFTINAMAMNCRGEIIDLFRGREDIEKRIIRCVGNSEARFKEDALRMFRAVRFASVLKFSVEDETKRAIISCAHLAKNLSGERVQSELEKILMSYKTEHIKFLADNKLLSHLGVENCDISVKNISKLPKNRKMRWCAICAVLEEKNEMDTEKLLRGLRLDKSTIKFTLSALKALKNGLPKNGPETAYAAELYGIEEVCAAFAAAEVLHGDSCYKKFKKELKTMHLLKKKEMAIDGNDILALGAVSGAKVGEIIDKLFRHVLNYPEDNKREKLINIAKKEIAKEE